jgi:hypothetical protein
VVQLVEALLYKPKGRGSIADGFTGICHLHNFSGRTMALVLTASNGNEYQEYFLG